MTGKVERSAAPVAGASTPRPEAPASNGAEPEFFSDDDALMALELAVAASGDDASPGAIVALAWQLRQRHPARALVLADEAEARLAGAPADAQRRWAARLQLVRAEADWLAGRLEAAAGRVDEALRTLAAVADALVRADAHWLRAMLAIDRGDWPGKDAELQAMAAAARGVDASRGDRRDEHRRFAEPSQRLPGRARVDAARAGTGARRGRAGRDGSGAAGQLWGVSLRYDLGGDHPLVGRSAPDFEFADGSTLASHLRAGRGVLIDLAGSLRLRQAVAPWSDRVGVVACGAQDELGLAALLVRPDGVVAWASDTPPAAADVAPVAARWFGSPSSVAS